jgi:aminoglycoside phosphotransferase (APT) family kinase protein
MPPVLPTLPAIAAALQRAFPGLTTVAPLSILGEGFSSRVVETPGGVVFRIPRTPEAGARYAREALLLPLLKPYLPVTIPEPHWFLAACDGFPHGVIGYPKLPGCSLDLPDLRDPSLHPAYAVQIAAVLLALHQIPPASLPDPWHDPYLTWQRQADTVLPVLKDRLKAGEYRRVAAWWGEFLADKTLRDYVPAVVHGDFWFGNLLAEDGRITGLVDFENLALGDPAVDFAALLYLGEDFYRQVLAAYLQQGGAVDPGFEHRLRAMWAVREFSGLDYAIRYDDPIELEDSLLKLRRGPILSPAGLNGWG